MKKLILFVNIIFFLCLSALFAVETHSSQSSDVFLYNEILLTFKNGFYPGTVDNAEELQKSYPDSPFMYSALAYKGDALIKMGSYQEAGNTLEMAISYMHSGSKEITRCVFLLGKSYFKQSKYSQAAQQFHKACSLAELNNEPEYYSQSLMYAGRIFFISNDYESAIPLFEYAVSNGSLYNQSDYVEAVLKLIISYNNTKNQRKTVKLFNNLFANGYDENKSIFSSGIYAELCLYNADANNALGQKKEAYESYRKIIELGDKKLSPVALKNAYQLSKDKSVSADSASLFADVEIKLHDKPELLDEFWVRLGIDEYEKNDFSQAETYFSKVNPESENFPVVLIYCGKIAVDSKNYSQAEELLIQNEQVIKKSQIKNINDSYYSLLLKCKYLQNKWDEIPLFFAKLTSPSTEDIYELSVYHYRKGEYSKVDKSTGELYASALCKLGKFNQACLVYDELKLNTIDYAKALFAAGRYQESYKVASITDDVQKDYVRGLCQINLKNWKDATTCLSSYIKQRSSNSDFMKLSFFYKGYSEYCAGSFKDSYASFVRYTLESGDEITNYVRKSYEYAAKSALQNGDFQNAAVQADKLIKVSYDEKEKQRAIIFNAEILIDYGDYEKAVSSLQPYTKQKNDFAVQALFVTARIYEKQGNLTNADRVYTQIYESFSRSEYAEEAMFKSGEIFYTNKDYASALTRLNKYIYRYPDGKFSQAALFYSGDSAYGLGEIDKSIVLNKTLLQKYSDSVYAYAASKNLLSAYYEQENYRQALLTAREIVQKFPKQAGDDEINKKVAQLEKIVNGTDKRIVEKQSEYERLGKSGTKKGRIAGSELVKLYAESSYTQKEAYDLANEILAKQTSDDEVSYAAENAEIIADFLRKDNQNKKAAEMYLKAARYFRSAGNSSEAASVLYSAVEAFVVEGLEGDASETSKLLKQLYPNSRQAEKVDRLFLN